MDKLVVTLAAVSQRIEHAKAVRIVDASKRRVPLQKKIGAGMSVDEFRAQVAAGESHRVYPPQSKARVARILKLPGEEDIETHRPVAPQACARPVLPSLKAPPSHAVRQP